MANRIQVASNPLGSSNVLGDLFLWLLPQAAELLSQQKAFSICACLEGFLELVSQALGCDDSVYHLEMIIVHIEQDSALDLG